jgi:ABC-2 type transport system ATP-binding protein
MNTAGCIGRTGGLAVALGIGAAVVSGYGVAWADPTGTTGGESSSTGTPSSSGATPATGQDATVAKSPTDVADAAKTPAQSKKPSRVKDLTKSLPGVDALGLPKNRPDTLRPPSGFIHEATETSTRTSTLATPKSFTTNVAKAQSPSGIPAVAAATIHAPEADRLATTPHVVSAPAAPRKPVDVAIGAMSNLVSSLVNPLAGTSPTSPPDSPATWAVMAAARRETLTGPSPLAVAQTTPVAVEQIAPLAGLQQLPIIGPVFVTPIVALIHQIPVVGDIIHPLIGYPVQLGLAPGTPVARDYKVTSFDGTQIYVHFMPAAGLQADQKAPTILNGPGLGMPGATNLDGTLLGGLITDNLGQVGIATLRNAGYNVVTWDPRGEYNSTGQLEIDSPDYEAKDVSAIITWLSTQPEAKLDGVEADHDPRIGMVGVSYGGGIQLVTAATDHRVDAIVPTIAWNTLNTSLYKSEAFKSGWGSILTGALVATLARPNPAIIPAAILGDLTGLVSPDNQALLADRGPGGIRELLGQITAPTLFIQGTVDTLFTLQETDTNMQEMAEGVPTKVLWFCGGHGLCSNDLLDQRDGALITQRTLEWLDRYVKADTAVQTGPKFEWVDQTGQYFASDTYPVAHGDPILAQTTTSQTLPLLPVVGGSGPMFFVLPIGGTKAGNALNLTTPAATTTTYIVGAPTLTLTYSGTGVGRHVYAQLVDSTSAVLGNQVTPIPVTLDGDEHELTIPLEMVAHTLQPGQTVTLQLVSSAASYQTIWSLGELNVSSMVLSLPTADPTQVTAEAIDPQSGAA